jgi:hypothetical protein
MQDRPLLTSLSNPLIKKIRALKNRKARVESRSFLVEGLHHVGSALEAGWDVEALLYAPELLSGDYAASLLDEARRSGISPQPVSAKVMDSLAEKDNPQGIVAQVKQRASRLSDLGTIRSGVALVSPQDPARRDSPAHDRCRRRGCALPARRRRGSVPSNVCARQHGNVILEACGTGQL